MDLRHIEVHVEELVLEAPAALREAAFRATFARTLASAIAERGLRPEISFAPVLDGGTLAVGYDPSADALGKAVAERVADTFTESPRGGAG